MAASFGCLVCLGTASQEPPQLPPPPGTAATSHLPLPSSPALPLTTPSIHDGQPTVANEPFWVPAAHSSVKLRSLAVRPDRLIFAVKSNAVFTAGFLST